MKILITGAAGFVGFHCATRLLAGGHNIIGIDNLNSYYDVSLKEGRLAQLEQAENFSFLKLDLSDRHGMAELFRKNVFDVVLHLGAQAGVRYSIENPFAYIESNVTGMLTVLEGCRHGQVGHLVYASSSSVYGANQKQPFSVEDRVDSPVSLYAATKKSNELMCQTYAHLYGLPCTGLRFFTVYGPWGRPDMAYYKFANAIMSNRPIDVYNHGNMRRDFTYVDDIVDGITSILSQPPLAAQGTPPHAVYNLGNSKPEALGDLIDLLERYLHRPAVRRYLSMQPGDVLSTYADIGKTSTDYGFSPKTSLQEGIRRFCDWYREYHKAS